MRVSDVSNIIKVLAESTADEVSLILLSKGFKSKY